MNTLPAAPGAGRSVADVVEAYEAARAERHDVRLADFLPPAGDPLYLPALSELIRVEMEHAWGTGKAKRLDDYRAGYPELFADRARLAEVAFEEYRLRRQAGERVRAACYRDRYGLDVSAWPVDETPGEAGDFPAVGGEFLGFHLRAELGRGAFGRVYLARQGELADRPVALKVSRDAHRESQTLARLQHTNIMPVYSVHQAPPFSAVCMPYLPSVTLDRVIRGEGGQETVPDTAIGLMETIRERSRTGPSESIAPAPSAAVWAPFVGRNRVDAVVWIGARLADGLAHAHERGIVHRDLKPANVLLTEDGQPLILDFNLADDERLPPGERAMLGGTLPYMAPEQLRALVTGVPQADPRGDIYALGLILYELLAGRRPFPDRTGDWQAAVGQMLADRAGPPPRLRPSVRGVTPAVEAIVRKCLEPDPARRYATARQLEEDLQRQFEHRPLRHQREPSLVERARKVFRRHPGMLSGTRVAVLAGLALAALAAGGAAWRHRALGLEAQGEWHRFRDDAQSVYLIPAGAVADRAGLDRRAGQLTGLLGRFHAIDDPKWDERRAVRRLPDADRDDLRQEVGELFHMLAQTQAMRALHEPAVRVELLNEALEWNARAQAAYPPDTLPRAVRYHRFEIYKLLAATPAGIDRADAARRAQEEWQAAAAIPLRRAGDYLLESMLPDRAQEAASLLGQAERLAGGDAILWYKLGLGWRNAGRPDRALVCLGTSIGLDRDKAWSWAARGAVRTEMGDAADAVADFDEALARKPDWDLVRSDRALAREKAGDLAGAETDLTDLIAEFPERVELLRQRERVRRLRGDTAGAGRDRNALLASRPTSAVGWLARAWAQSDPKAALADLDAALKLDPNHRDSLQKKAEVLSERLNRPADAIAVLTHEIKQHPTAASALAGRAVLRARRGDRDGGLADARAALKVAREPLVVYQAANTFALTSPKAPGDRREALKLLAEAFRRDPKLLDLVADDPDFGPIRNDPDFRALVEAARRVFK